MIEKIDLRESLQDFADEDDPLISLRRHRREISDRFETVSELTTYLKQFDSIEDVLKRVRSKIVEQSKE
jgi:hypothetical protein